MKQRTISAFRARRGTPRLVVLAVALPASFLAPAPGPARPSMSLAARGESPAAFGRHGIPPYGVAPPSHTGRILGRRALQAWRRDALGATQDFHHGLLGPPELAEGRPSNQSQEPTSVSISQSTGPPDGQVVLPLHLSTGEGVEVGAISIRLGFPKALLAFVKMEPSGLAVAVEAKLQSEVKAAASHDSSELHASVSTIAEGGSRRPLPVGPVAYLVFKVDKRAQPKTVIALTHEASAMTTADPPRRITPVVASKAEIVVSTPAVISCFFYMH